MKKTTILSIALLVFSFSKSQIFTVASGTDVTIKAGTTFSADNLSITPSSDFTISNNSLTRSTTAVHTPVGTYIARVYQFTNTTNAFSGSIQMNYLDGAELNGLAENVLTLNAHNGTNWSAFSATTRDATNNFILTNSISAYALNELTLASQQTPLPVTLLYFTAIRQNKSSQLQWKTAQEQNSKNFIVQTSYNGIIWTNLTTIPAAGNSAVEKTYSYLHTNPLKGSNFYRLIQTDLNEKIAYSPVRMLKFTEENTLFTIINNPVKNGVLSVQVNEAGIFNIYTLDGKLLWSSTLNIGTHFINVSQYPRSTYLLNSRNYTLKFPIL